MPDEGPPLRLDRHGHVAVVALDRPHRLNAFTAEGYAALAAVLSELDDDAACRAIVIQGAGRAFSSGVDLDALRAGEPEAFGAAFFPMIATLAALRTPLIAGVHGAAVGIGATLLLHCDVVVVAHDARIRFPFSALGTAPEAGSSVLLAKAVGAQRAAELLLTARWLDGDEAVRIGLAAHAVDASDVAATARAIAADIAALPQAAVAEAKRLLRLGASDAGHVSEVARAVERETEAGRRLSAELGRIGG